jgi:transcriptional regulator with XRE-family HTH domain
MLGLSQEKLGERLNLTFQQVQKYERGANRVGASRLQELSEILGVPIVFFFEHADPVRAPAFGDKPEPVEQFEPGGRELLETFYNIGDQAIRRSLLGLAKTLA